MDFTSLNLASMLTPEELRAMASAMEKLNRAKAAASVPGEATTSIAPPAAPPIESAAPTAEQDNATIDEITKSVHAEGEQVKLDTSGAEGDDLSREVEEAHAAVYMETHPETGDPGTEVKGGDAEAKEISGHVPGHTEGTTENAVVKDSKPVDESVEKEVSRTSQESEHTNITQGRRTRNKGKAAASGVPPSSKRKAESTTSDGRMVRVKTEVQIRRDAPKDFPKSSDKSCPGIVRDMAFDPDFLINNELGLVVEVITCQGWDELFVGPAMVDVGLVKEFYKSLELVSTDKSVTVSFKVGKEKFRFNEKVLATILEIPVEGYEEFYGGIPIDVTEGEVHEVVMGTGDNMPVVSRVLLEYLAMCFLPRGGKHTVPSTYEEVLLWKILTRAPVNLPKIILQLMVVVKKSQSNKLPYPRLVKKILQYFRVYNPKSEVCCSRQLNEGHLGRINYVWVDGSGWVHKYDLTEEEAKKEKEKTVVVDDAEDKEPDEDTSAVSQRKDIIRLLQSMNDKLDQLITAQSTSHST